MASRLLHPTLLHPRTPLLIATGLGVSAALLSPSLLHTVQRRHALRLDSSPAPVSPKDWSFSQYQADAQTPVFTQEGRLNARAVRQMSAGSVIGLVAGLGLSLFSKPLAVLLGLLIVGVQTAESYGIHLVPYRSMQRYVRNIDLRSAVQDNAAFKISLGMMFALSAFAEF